MVTKNTSAITVVFMSRRIGKSQGSTNFICMHYIGLNVPKGKLHVKFRINDLNFVRCNPNQLCYLLG